MACEAPDLGSQRVCIWRPHLQSIHCWGGQLSEQETAGGGGSGYAKTMGLGADGMGEVLALPLPGQALGEAMDLSPAFFLYTMGFMFLASQGGGEARTRSQVPQGNGQVMGLVKRASTGWPGLFICQKKPEP